MNPATSPGISIGIAVSSIAAWLREITVRVNGAHGSHGSGVIWRPNGLIVTNAHVAGSQVHAVELFDGRKLEAWLVARDPARDLAALAVGAHSLPSASVRSTRTCRPGELVIAVGNPIDGEGAVSTGIFHRLSGKRPFLFADIRLAPGNSGGPLADAEGNVIGINSAIIDSLGCAVTSDAVQAFLRTAGLLDAHPTEAA
jgi:serine protease Do